jgi:glutaredoxin
MKGDMMLNIKTGLLLTIMVMCTLGVGWSADMYQWVDEKGVTHIEDNPPGEMSVSNSLEVKKIKDIMEPSSKLNENPTERKSTDDQAVNMNANIEIYTTSWCHFCRQAKEYFKKKGVSYNEHDVDKSKEAMRRKNEISSSGGVPVTVINGQVINGFSEEVYEAALRGKP